MTEPIAWKILKKSNWRWEIVTDYPNNYIYQEAIPLYTAEQLQPRVKMTQAEFDEFNRLAGDNVYYALYKVANHEEFYPSLYKRLFKIDRVESNIAQTEFAGLWSDYDQDNPEEKIEIVPDMKWFVRSKEKYHPDMDQGITESGYLYLTQGDIYSIEYYETTPFKDEAQQFNTKEEAELWTNPLTEAVQLPVEGE